ncbi:MAG: DUF2259 domain-containing protein [Candidatus Cloacimonetes bacterium]|nr:DUF2259 domain-containing protein [Candidatus Cloacimonadota bacterium]
MKKPILIIFFILILTVYAFSGDISDYSILGFSEDGRYVAFEYTGIADGSAFPYIYVHIYDCEKHQLAEEPYFLTVQINEDEDFEKGTSLVWDISYEDITKIKEKYGIVDTLKGVPVMERVEFSPPVINFGMQIGQRKIVLEIEEYSGEESYYDMYNPSGIVITIEVNGAQKLLFQAQPATEMHKFRFDYSLEQIVVFKNTVVAIISFHAPGFEGHNIRQMAVGYMIP